MALSLYDFHKNLKSQNTTTIISTEAISTVTETADGLMSKGDKVIFDVMKSTITNLQTQVSTLASSGGGASISDDPTFSSLTVTGQTILKNLDVDSTGIISYGEELVINNGISGYQKMIPIVFPADNEIRNFVIVNNVLYASTGDNWGFLIMAVFLEVFTH